jgi:hypothetical protein
MTATIGILRSSARREVLGTFQVETRMNLGEELPTEQSERWFEHEKCIRALVYCDKVGGRLWDVTPWKGHIYLVFPFCTIRFNAIHG